MVVIRLAREIWGCCLRACLCTTLMPGACRGQMGASDPLETIVSLHGAGNQTWVLWKRSQYSEPSLQPQEILFNHYCILKPPDYELHGKEKYPEG